MRDGLPTKTNPSIIGSSFKSMLKIFCKLAKGDRACQRLRSRTGVVGGRLLGVGSITGVRVCKVRAPAVSMSIDPSIVTRDKVAASSVTHTFRTRGGIISTKNVSTKRGQLHVRSAKGFCSLSSVEGLAVMSHSNRRFHLTSVTRVRRDCRAPTDGLVHVSNGPTVNVTVSAIPAKGMISVTRTIGGHVSRLSRSVPRKCRLASVCSRKCRSTITGRNFILGLVVSILAIVTVLLFFVKFGGNALVNDKLVFSVFTALVIVVTYNVTLRQVSLITVVVTVKVLMSGTVIISSSTLVGVRHKVQGHMTVVRTYSAATLPLLTTAMVTVLAFLPVCCSPRVANRLLSSLIIIVKMSLVFD